MCRILGVVELSKSTDYVTIREMLKSYQKSKEYTAWDTFRQKVPEDILALWSEILRECRRNGFMGPWAYDENIYWHQVITINHAQGDLCTLCGRECVRRDDLDSGESRRRKQLDVNYEEPAPCWKGTRQ